MLPDAPGRFSTITFWLRLFDRPSARMRAATSGVEPPGKPTTIFSGLVGQAVVVAARAVDAARIGALPAVRGALAVGGRTAADAAAVGAAGLDSGALAGCASAAAATRLSANVSALRRASANEQRNMQDSRT